MPTRSPLHERSVQPEGLCSARELDLLPSYIQILPVAGSCWVPPPNCPATGGSYSERRLLVNHQIAAAAITTSKITHHQSARPVVPVAGAGVGAVVVGAVVCAKAGERSAKVIRLVSTSGRMRFSSRRRRQE
jgi:hypothetical protein